MTKALSITSTRHATAITLYAGLAGLGLLHILNVAGHQWVTDVAGEALTSLWASLYFTGPAVALASATLAPAIRVPVYPLWAEAGGCALIAATNLFIVYCVLDQLGFAAAANVSTTMGVIAVGMLARIWQIVREQTNMRRAQAHPRPADPAPLAEADHNRG